MLFSPQILTGRFKPAAISLDAATTAWVNAVVSAGGSVSAGRQTIVDTFIKALKAASLFTVLDRYWLLAGENTQSANIDMINLGTWTSHGTFNFSASNGYTGDGSTGYGDSNFNPNTASGHFVLNSASIGARCQTNRTTGADTYLFGALDGGFTTGTDLEPYSSGGSIFARVNGIASTGNTHPTTVKGSWALSRTSSVGTVIYQDGSSFVTTTDVSITLTPQPIYFGALNFGGSPFGGTFSTDQISSFWLGGGMSSGQITSFENAQSAMMTSLGL